MNRKNVSSNYRGGSGNTFYDPNSLSRSQTVQSQQRKRVPPEQTHAENYYYKKQMEGRTPMVFVMTDGETITGTIEWYDKNCIKVHRVGAPNLLVFKRCIKYVYKEEKFSVGDNGSETS